MGGNPQHPSPIGGGGGLVLGILLLTAAVPLLQAATQQDFFQSYGKGDILRQGDSEFEMVKLDPPMPFYSQTFDHIYVSNGYLYKPPRPCAYIVNRA